MASTSLTSRLEARVHLAAVATIALVAISYFTAIIIVLHFVRSSLDPMERPTSEYAVGPHGYLMTTAFLAVSLASFMLVIGLSRGIAPPAQSRIGLGLLGLLAIGVLVAMIFPIDPEGAARTTSGTIHRINGPLAFLSLSSGAVLVSRRLKEDERWQPAHRWALILSVGMLTLWILTPLAIILDTGIVGLVQRALLITFVAWFVLMATRLRKISSRAAFGVAS